MATVNQGGKNGKEGSQNGDRSSSYQEKPTIAKTEAHAGARDNLSGAYAGKENRGPEKNQKANSQHSTNVKGRVTEESKTKTPKR